MRGHRFADLDVVYEAIGLIENTFGSAGVALCKHR